jgi:hypothetical protein
VVVVVLKNGRKKSDDDDENTEREKSAFETVAEHEGAVENARFPVRFRFVRAFSDALGGLLVVVLLLLIVFI